MWILPRKMLKLTSEHFLSSYFHCFILFFFREFSIYLI